MEPFRSRPGRENFFPNPTRPKILSFGTTQNTTLIERLRDLLGRDQRGEKSLPSIWPNTTKIIFLDLLGRNPVGVTMPGNQKCKNPSFCRSMNSYRIVMKWTRYKKPLPSSEVVFESYFWRAPTHPLHPIGQKLICGSFWKPSCCSLKCFWAPGTYRGRKCAPNTKIFSTWSSYSIRSCPKNFWYQATPQGPPPQIKNSRFFAYWPNFDSQTPGVGGVGAPKFFCHKTTSYKNHFI